jgi:hypothetical protein
LKGYLALSFMLMIGTVSGTASAADSSPMGDIAIGKPFPTVWLPSAEDGQAMSVSQLRGHKLVLHIFASW